MEATKRGIPVEQTLFQLERELSNGETLGIITPSKTELITYQSEELEDLVIEISSGKVSLTNLAEQLHLSIYQVHAIAENLLKTGRITGELTYISFTSNRWAKKVKLQRAVAHKRQHRLDMQQKKK